MNTIQKLAVSAIATATLLGLGACSGMTQQEKGTAVGAGVGAIGGSVLTGGPSEIGWHLFRQVAPFSAPSAARS